MLARYPNRPTQLYALAGVHRTDPPAYRELATQQRAMGGSVETVVGWVIRDLRIGQLVDEVDRGKWTTELLYGRLITRMTGDEDAAA